MICFLNTFLSWHIPVYTYLSSYPGYFREPPWNWMGLPEISRVTWQVFLLFWDQKTRTNNDPELFTVYMCGCILCIVFISGRYFMPCILCHSSGYVKSYRPLQWGRVSLSVWLQVSMFCIKTRRPEQNGRFRDYIFKCIQLKALLHIFWIIFSWYQSVISFHRFR